ncbi:MAG TPA: response regulator [Planctomycetota bacterium]|nr:response regulator [Planctomycetota bacterium]
MIAPLSILFADPQLAGTRPHRMDLRARGAQVGFADTPGDVLRHAEEDPPDLLILDENLQSGTDEDVIRLYQKASPSTEIILLHDGASAMPHGSGLGLLGSVGKPFSRESLRELIEGAFPGRLAPAAAASAAPPPILCVDDDRSYLHSLSRLLGRRGYPVFALESSKQALDMLPRHPFPLALVDIMMTGMDGIRLTQEIRRQSCGRTAVVVLSALDCDEATYLSLENGARFCLTKPCASEELFNVVDYVAGTVDEEERRLLENRMAGSSIPRGAA